MDLNWLKVNGTSCEGQIPLREKAFCKTWVINKGANACHVWPDSGPFSISLKNAHLQNGASFFRSQIEHKRIQTICALLVKIRFMKQHFSSLTQFG